MPKQNQIKQAAKDTVFSYFHDPKVAVNIWQELENSGLSELEQFQTVKKRILKIEKIKTMAWTNLRHVVGLAQKYKEIFSYDEACSLLPKAVKFYYKFFKNHLPGNLTIDCEIGFNQIDKHSPKIYNIHTHIMCEEEAYEAYKKATPKLRIGKSSNFHIMATRMKDKEKEKQTYAEYALNLSNYIAKISLLQGNSKSNNRAISLPNATEYYRAKLNIKSFIRIVKKGGKTDYLKIKKHLNHLYFQFKSWEILKQKKKSIVFLKGFSAKPTKIEDLWKIDQETFESAKKHYKNGVLPHEVAPFYLEYDTI